MTTIPFDPSKALNRGISACRAGNWWEGHNQLTRLAQAEEGYGKLPSLFYSYLGQAMARCEGRRREGLELCLHAVGTEPFQPENYLNLAECYLLVRNRRGALRTIEKGLRIDASHRGLLEVNRRLGERRRPAIRFLDRKHPVNRYVGILTSKIRNTFQGWRHPEDDADDDFWTTSVRSGVRSTSASAEQNSSA